MSPEATDRQPTESQGWMRMAIMLAVLVLLTKAAGWWGLVIVLGIVVMITLHEAGHYIMAKRAGMKVTEFFIGFGPRIWSFTRGETEYGIKAIPAGAYVRIIGMSAVEEVEPEDEQRTYRVKPFWQRFGVAVAGSTMHFIQAFVLIFVILVFFGTPGGTWMLPQKGPFPVVISSIYAHCPANQAGLKPDDEITSINGHAVTDMSDVSPLLDGKGGETVAIGVKRGDQRLVLRPTLLRRTSHGVPSGLLGITYSNRVHHTEKVNALAAIPQTFHELGYSGWTSVKAIGHIFTPSSIKSYGRQVVDAQSNRQSDEVAASTTSPPTSVVRDNPSVVAPPASKGPLTVKSCLASMGGPAAFTSSSIEPPDQSSRFLSLYGIFQIGKSQVHTSGVVSLLGLFALLNVFIGVFNLTPTLPFDGGHVVIAVYEKFQEWRKHLTGRYYADLTKIMPVVYAVILVLGLIFVTSLYLDIANPVTVK